MQTRKSRSVPGLGWRGGTGNNDTASGRVGVMQTVEKVWLAGQAEPWDGRRDSRRRQRPSQQSTKARSRNQRGAGRQEDSGGAGLQQAGTSWAGQERRAQDTSPGLCKGGSQQKRDEELR